MLCSRTERSAGRVFGLRVPQPRAASVPEKMIPRARENHVLENV